MNTQNCTTGLKLIDGATSSRINVIRFILMVLVVFIHNDIFSMLNTASILTDIPWYFHITRLLIADSLGCCAVPLFFFISAYLFYTKNDTYTAMLQKKFRTIFIPYVLWTFIAVGCMYLLQLIPQMHFFKSSTNDFSNFTLVDWIDIFIGRFTKRQPYPLVFSFWYLRDLMLMMIISPVIKKLIDTIPVCFFSLVLVWWFHFAYGQVSSAILFYSLGYVAVKRNFTAATLDRIRFCDICILYFILAIANVCFQFFGYTNHSEVITAFSNSVRAFTIFSGCVFMLRITRFLVQNKAASMLSNLSCYTFWLYAVHAPVLLTVLAIVILPLVPLRGAWIYVPYFGIVIIGIAIALILGRVVKKMTPKLYALLTGGR